MKKQILFIFFVLISTITYGQQVSLCGEYIFENNLQLGGYLGVGNKGSEKLFFGSSSERDVMYLQRFNDATTKSELRVNMGTESYGRFTLGSNATGTQVFDAKIVFTGKGNLGLGVLEPSCRLDVKGTTKTDSLIIGNHFQIGHSLGVGGGQGKILWFGPSSEREKMYITRYNNSQTKSELRINMGSENYGRLAFGSHALNSLVFDAKIIFTADGNVGIKCLQPKVALDVNGTIRAKKLKTEICCWSDFVFAEDYALPALSEVKAHIEKNKHLPGIPTEAEVMENGIDVGEMQAKLLQKVEELTLYIIQQEERMLEMQKEIEELKNKKENL